MSCYGYAGKVVRIDLSTQRISEYPWTDQDRTTYLGGKTMAAQLLRCLLTGEETALSVANSIVITTGPLTGTGAPGSERFDIATLSPKDDLPTFSNCGGDFGTQLKKAGYDALILTGRCKSRCWLEIQDGSIRFHDAGLLWGTGTVACQEILAQHFGTTQFGRLCIGPAGENLTPYASVVSGDHTSGRAGIGAVLGYKNLKAITVTGSSPVLIFSPQEAVSVNRQWHGVLRQRSSGADTICTGCPLHCLRHPPGEYTALLNDLGIDAMTAELALSQSEPQSLSPVELYRSMAHQPPQFENTAKMRPHRAGKGRKRRGSSHNAIIRAFHLVPGLPETEDFCQIFTDAVSSAGQCIFTVNALSPSLEPIPELPILKMLPLVTGKAMDLDQFLEIGQRFHQLERSLRHKKA